MGNSTSALGKHSTAKQVADHFAANLTGALDEGRVTLKASPQGDSTVGALQENSRS